MLTFEKIIEKIKDIISTAKGDKKVFDKDVACVLEINVNHLAILKKRNKIPLEEILNFALKYRIDANWLFFGIRIIR